MTVTAINEFAAVWGSQIWKASWQGGAALLLVWLTCRVVRRIPAQAQCWLWRLGFLKLLVAGVVLSAIELPWLPAHAQPNPEVVLAKVAPILDPVQPNSSPDFLEHDNEPQVPLERQANEPIESPVQRAQAPMRVLAPAEVVEVPVAAPAMSLAGWLLFAWGVGVFCLAANLARLWRSARRMTSILTPVLDNGLQARLVELCERMRIQKPDLRTCEGAGSPFLIGYFRPTVVLPSAALQACSAEALDAALLHELAHLKRRDLVWNLLPALVETLFFFHPLVWLSRREWRLAQEIATDELAISKSQGGASEYARRLVELVAATSRGGHFPHFAVGISEAYTQLTKRVNAMQTFRMATPRRQIVLALSVAMIVAGGLVPWRLTERTAQAEPPATEPIAGATPAAQAGKERPVPLTGAELLKAQKDAVRWLGHRPWTLNAKHHFRVAACTLYVQRFEVAKEQGQVLFTDFALIQHDPNAAPDQPPLMLVSDGAIWKFNPRTAAENLSPAEVTEALFAGNVELRQPGQTTITTNQLTINSDSFRGFAKSGVLNIKSVQADRVELGPPVVVNPNSRREAQDAIVPQQGIVPNAPPDRLANPLDRQARDITHVAPPKPGERWIEVGSVGDEIVNMKQARAFTADQAKQLFGNNLLKLPAGWENFVPPNLERTIDARDIPEQVQKQLMPARQEPYGAVLGFSSQEVEAAVLKPRGSYLWHHYLECMVRIRVPRSPEIDALFQIPQFAQTYGAEFKGVRQGSSGREVQQALGEPSSVRHTQAVGFFTQFYAKEGLSVVFLNGRVEQLHPGISHDVVDLAKDEDSAVPFAIHYNGGSVLHLTLVADQVAASEGTLRYTVLDDPHNPLSGRTTLRVRLTDAEEKQFRAWARKLLLAEMKSEYPVSKPRNQGVVDEHQLTVTMGSRRQTVRWFGDSQPPEHLLSAIQELQGMAKKINRNGPPPQKPNNPAKSSGS